MALVSSMLGVLANKVKFSALFANKNKKLGQSLLNTFNFLFEQLLPDYCAKNFG